MDELQTLIHTTHDAREVKRALAVQNTVAGRSRAAVAKELGYTVSWVDKWRWRDAQSGSEGLRIGSKGSQSSVTPQQNVEIHQWLYRQTTWDVRSLAAHSKATDGVHYQSVRSYHALLNAARMSWKKPQDDHPEADPQQVSAKREEIKKNTDRSPRHRAETERDAPAG